MIYLSQNNDEVSSVLCMFFGKSAIRNAVELYFKAYGVHYDFAQFYIQKSEDNKPSALILRYNRCVYCVSADHSDKDELSEFLSGLIDTEVISDCLLNMPVIAQDCTVMAKKGNTTDDTSKQVCLVTDAKLVSSLVGESLSEDETTDFFLNTSHQMRHNLLAVYGILKDKKLISTASVYVNENAEGFIHFVYTSRYFRGNGLSKSVLNALCNNSLITYRLLCEEHNAEFYKKCGFTKEATWYKYNL